MKTVTFSTVFLAVLVMAAASPATRVGGGGGNIARCQCACTPPFDAVCARQGRAGIEETFPSKCHLECYNCTHNTEFVVLYKRECEENNRH